MRSLQQLGNSRSAEKLIILHPQNSRTENGWIHRGCRITRNDGNQHVAEDMLWYEFMSGTSVPGVEIVPPDDADSDSYLLAILFDAMREGRRIFVRGNVCKTLLSNLVEFQAAWHKWVPGYRVQPIEVEGARCLPSTSGAVDAGRDGKAICAFSGGVDATFSV